MHSVLVVYFDAFSSMFLLLKKVLQLLLLLLLLLLPLMLLSFLLLFLLLMLLLLLSELILVWLFRLVIAVTGGNDGLGVDFSATLSFVIFLMLLLMLLLLTLLSPLIFAKIAGHIKSCIMNILWFIFEDFLERIYCSYIILSMGMDIF